MPLKKCSDSGKSGWKWGDSGHCYTGPKAKQDAIKQGVAIEGSDKVRKMLASSAQVGEYEIECAIAEFRAESNKPGFDHTTAYIPQAERNKLHESDFGWPEERKYPIRNQSDLDAAVRLIGRAPQEEQSHIRRRIKEIARRKNLTLPDSWVNE